jgi:hypothetical protein
MREKETRTKYLFQRLKRINHSEDLGVDGKYLEIDYWMCTGTWWMRFSTREGFFLDGIEPFSSIQGGEFVHNMSN